MIKMDKERGEKMEKREKVGDASIIARERWLLIVPLPCVIFLIG